MFKLLRYVAKSLMYRLNNKSGNIHICLRREWTLNNSVLNELTRTQELTDLYKDMIAFNILPDIADSQRPFQSASLFIKS